MNFAMMCRIVNWNMVESEILQVENRINFVLNNIYFIIGSCIYFQKLHDTFA